MHIVVLYKGFIWKFWRHPFIMIKHALKKSKLIFLNTINKNDVIFVKICGKCSSWDVISIDRDHKK